jgi:hypothetical protein
MIAEIASAWCETGIPCPDCGGMTYSDGKHRPQCGDTTCLATVPDEQIWTWLITVHTEEGNEQNT